jgi:cytochrome b6-f complex iron-sulfur subunit
MERGDFIRVCGLACLGATTLGVFLPGCGSANYFAHTELQQEKLAIRKSEFAKVRKDKVRWRKYVLVRADRFTYPICVYRFSEDEYSALLLQCTHKGCELNPHGDYLVCPCHGSEFTNKGAVQNPPAEKNLLSFKTGTDNDHVYIEL